MSKIDPDQIDYDWHADAFQSWLDAIAAIRGQLLVTGRIKPRDDADDQAWFERMKARAT